MEYASRAGDDGEPDRLSPLPIGGALVQPVREAMGGPKFSEKARGVVAASLAGKGRWSSKKGPRKGGAGPTGSVREDVRLGADWTAATLDALTDVKTCQQKPGGHAGRRAKRINVGAEASLVCNRRGFI
jgi:hypothetical protein